MAGESDMSRRLVRLAGVLVVALLAACQSSDDARVLQTLNQRGFGRPTQDANRQYYVGIGDTIAIQDSIHTEYNGVSETVRMDGVITLPEVREVYVNGLSPDQITELLRLKYAQFVTDSSGLTIRVVGLNSKRYYVSGLPPRKPNSIKFEGDTLLVDAMIKAVIDPVLVDCTRIKVIRGDPENPLVIVCNYEAIIEEGLTRDNIQIRENDVVFLTPSIIGYITAFVEALIAPIKPITSLFINTNNVIAVSDSFGKGTVGYGYNNN